MIDQKVELLRRVPLFAGLDEAGLAEVARIADEVDTEAGTVLTHEGRHEGWFFVVVSGSVKIDRERRAINLLGPGEFLGEIALLDGGPRTATATRRSRRPCSGSRTTTSSSSSTGRRRSGPRSWRPRARLRALEGDSVV